MDPDVEGRFYDEEGQGRERIVEIVDVEISSEQETQKPIISDCNKGVSMKSFEN